MQCQEYKSFLIRLWRDADDDRDAADDEARPTWRGEIEHIQSGTRWNFGTLDALLAFLRETPGAAPPELEPGRGE